jgi:hypothetical protein
MGATGSAARGGTSVEKVGRPYPADPMRDGPGKYVRHKRHKLLQGMLAGSRGETFRRNNVRGKLPFV